MQVYLCKLLAVLCRRALSACFAVTVQVDPCKFFARVVLNAKGRSPHTYRHEWEKATFAGQLALAGLVAEQTYPTTQRTTAKCRATNSSEKVPTRSCQFRGEFTTMVR